MPGATGMLGTMLGPAVIINWSAPNGKTQIKTINTKVSGYRPGRERDCHFDFFAFLATRKVTRQIKRDWFLSTKKRSLPTFRLTVPTGCINSERK